MCFLQEVFSLDESNYTAHVFAGLAELELGHPQQAGQHYRTAVGLQPGEQLAWKVSNLVSFPAQPHDCALLFMLKHMILEAGIHLGKSLRGGKSKLENVFRGGGGEVRIVSSRVFNLEGLKSPWVGECHPHPHPPQMKPWDCLFL